MNNQQLILLLSLDLPTKLSKEQSKQLADEFIFLEKRIAELEKDISFLQSCVNSGETANISDRPSERDKQLKEKGK